MKTKGQQIGRLIVRLFIVIALLSIGFIFLFLPTDPGYSSNLVAWLETEGSHVSHTFGVSFLLLGITGLLYITKKDDTKNITIQKGPLICSIDRSLFEKAAQKLWEERFPKHTCHTSIRKQKLQIIGNVPEGFNEEEDLSSYITEKLFALTGYWGEISLTLTKKTDT